MFIEIILFAVFVQAVGLLSMSMVTGQPLNKTFKDTNMMCVFFCIGVILALIAYATVIVNTCNSGCDRNCGCDCDKCRGRQLR